MFQGEFLDQALLRQVYLAEVQQRSHFREGVQVVNDVGLLVSRFLAEVEEDWVSVCEGSRPETMFSLGIRGYSLSGDGLRQCFEDRLGVSLHPSAILHSVDNKQEIAVNVSLLEQMGLLTAEANIVEQC